MPCWLEAAGTAFRFLGSRGGLQGLGPTGGFSHLWIFTAARMCCGAPDRHPCCFVSLPTSARAASGSLVCCTWSPVAPRNDTEWGLTSVPPAPSFPADKRCGFCPYSLGPIVCIYHLFAWQHTELTRGAVMQPGVLQLFTLSPKLCCTLQFPPAALQCEF